MQRQCSNHLLARAHGGLLAAITLAALAGCGGGGGGSSGSVGSLPSTSSSSTPPVSTPTPTPTPAPNQAPTISGTPPTAAVEGNGYSFQPTASDANGDALTFSAAGLPSWLSINSGTGNVNGTVPTGSAGTYSGVVITVTDGKASASLPAFSITVTAPIASPPPNAAPVISGTPPTSVVAGQAYSFQPTASDPDSATLRFGIANKPAWASFDVVTGRLSGTPAAADAGVYANIVISVSDGTDSATLPTFTLTVVAPPAAGIAELQWTAPTRNEDGSALTNLAGYRVRYGTSPTELSTVLDIASPATTSARIEGLKAGTWYFTVASYTNTGVESAPTGAVSKTIS